jgi:ribonuclease E
MAVENDDKTTPTLDTTPVQPVAEDTAVAESVVDTAGTETESDAAADAAASSAETAETAEAPESAAEPEAVAEPEQSAETEAPEADVVAQPEVAAVSEVPAEPEAPAEPETPQAVTAVSLGLIPEVFVSKVSTQLHFYAPEIVPLPASTRREDDDDHEDDDDRGSAFSRRGGRRRRGSEADESRDEPRQRQRTVEYITEPKAIKGSTRLEAKKQRRRDGRDAGRRRPVVTEAEFLARREAVDRMMVVRAKNGRTQIGVVEDNVLVEHYVARNQDASLIGNVYLGRVQNVLPSMEAAFVDIGRGRNAVLYSGEVDWDAAAENASGEGKGQQARRIELALKPGDKVLVQVTKDPIGHKGARLTSQVSLPGRYLVYVPNGSMNGISRKLPDTERARLKKILKEVLPENVGVIVRTAAEGATEEQLTLDVNRLTSQWAALSKTLENSPAPALLHSEPDLLIKIIRDVFNEDFHKLVIDGEDAAKTINAYLSQVAPDLMDRVETYDDPADSFDKYRVSEQIEKALDRKVWLPSGGSLVIDRTEAMTVVDVNTGKFVGSGGNLEETVTKNNLEAAEEIVRQLRLRDIGGIIVVDFIDMVLESNRDLVLRRLVECLGRDRTKHQVAEVTSLGLVQMTRKRMGTGLLEVFGEECEHCAGAGVITHDEPVESRKSFNSHGEAHGKKFNDKPSRNSRRRRGGEKDEQKPVEKQDQAAGEKDEATRNALASIAAASHLDGPADNAVSIEGEQIPVTKSVVPAQATEASVTMEALEAALPGKEESSEEHDGSRKPRRRSRSRGRNRNQAEESASTNEDAQASQEQQAAPEPVAAPKSEEQPRKRSRSASRPQDSAQQDQPVLTGLAMPAASAPAAATAPAPASAPAAATATPQISTKPKRRSRRATSVQGNATAEVLVAEVSAATGSVVQMDASGSKKEKPAEPAGNPVMLGVGVPVRELK